MAGVILRITTAPHEGYRRAGRAWSKESQEVEASVFTSEQLAQLRNDPRLKIVEIEPEAKKGKGKSA